MFFVALPNELPVSVCPPAPYLLVVFFRQTQVRWSCVLGSACSAAIAEWRVTPRLRCDTCRERATRAAASFHIRWPGGVELFLYTIQFLVADVSSYKRLLVNLVTDYLILSPWALQQRAKGNPYCK